jgi:protein TonB
VIAAGPDRHGVHKDALVKGWLVSILLHGTVALAALLLVKQIHLTPQDESFKWNVTMVSPVQPVQKAVSVPNEALVASVPSTTSVPSPKMQQTAPAQNIPLLQPLDQQPTPSISERDVTSVMAEPLTPAPLQPAHLSQSVLPTTQPTEPIDHEPVAPAVAKAHSIEKPADAPTTVSAESGAQSAPSSAPSAIQEQTERPHQATPTQIAAISPTPPSTPAKRDYGWLSETILRRVEELKRYPASARVDRAEGKVVVKAVINEDGSVGEVEVFQSSGHLGLDKAAIETLRQAAPFHLPHPLGKPGMTIKIPMSYRLDR